MRSVFFFLLVVISLSVNGFIIRASVGRALVAGLERFRPDSVLISMLFLFYFCPIESPHGLFFFIHG